jgi:manganese/zinc/iron transport system permease protein
MIAIPPRIEITLVLVAIAVACALPGVFLVLRRMSLVSDAISHVMLFGIVIAYFLIGDLDSPWLLAGAAATGVLTVAFVEALQRTRLVKEDAAIGLVFPALFALGALLVTMFMRNVHLDIDSVLMGQPGFAFRPRWYFGGVPIKPLAVLAVVALLNAGLIAIFYKELKLATFDPALAAALGFVPFALHYGLMTLVSLTAVVSFDAAGPVTVVAFFIVPAASAYLLTDRLSIMLLLSAVFGATAAVAGTELSLELDTNIPGTIAVVLGMLFTVVFIAAPRRGLVVQAIHHWSQHRRFLETMLAIHLFHHEGTAVEEDECRVTNLHQHLEWEPARVRRVVSRAEGRDLVRVESGLLKLTPGGRAMVRDVLNV